jgi:hypothetical protein
MKEVQMTFRVESALRASFTQAAEREHRPAAQVLRGLMRAYVGQVRAVPVQVSATERSSREDAAHFAKASVGLEGFRITEEDEALTQRFIAGEISLDDVLLRVPGASRRP